MRTAAIPVILLGLLTQSAEARHSATGEHRATTSSLDDHTWCNAVRAPARTARSTYSFTFQKPDGTTATGQVIATLSYNRGALNRVNAVIQVVRLDQPLQQQLINPNPNPIPGLRVRVNQLYSNSKPRCRSSQSTWETNIESNGVITRQMYSATRDLESLYMKTTVSVRPGANAAWINNAIPLLEMSTP